MSSLNILTVWMRESRALSFLEYNLKSSMSSRWFSVSPVRNSFSCSQYVCQRYGDGTNSNGGSASPWKIPLFIGTSPSLSAPQVSFTHQNFIVFSRRFTTFFAILVIFKLSITQEWGQGLKLSVNQCIPLLSSSSFILFPEEAPYLFITVSQYPSTSFSILSSLAIVSFYSLEKHRFY